MARAATENLRRRYDYENDNPFCELTPWFKRYLPDQVDHNDPSLDIHHIFHVGQRYDLVSNLIAISRSVHQWGHLQHPVDFRVLCLWKKWKKGELNLDEVRLASGKASLAGNILWLPHFPQVRCLRDEMLDNILETVSCPISPCAKESPPAASARSGSSVTATEPSPGSTSPTSATPRTGTGSATNTGPTSPPRTSPADARGKLKAKPTANRRSPKPRKEPKP